jgi:hypothetical protein
MVKRGKHERLLCHDEDLLYDKYRMNRKAISVTLAADNLAWLKGRVGAGVGRSVSDVLDRLVTDARQGGRVGPSRSVVGTVDIDSADPLLETADASVRALFDASVGRPLLVRERRAEYRGRARVKKRRA